MGADMRRLPALTAASYGLAASIAAASITPPAMADAHDDVIQLAANATWICEVAQTTDLVEDGEANMLVTMTFSMPAYSTNFTGTSEQTINLDGTEYHTWHAFDGYAFDEGDDDFGLFIQNDRTTRTEPPLPPDLHWNAGGTTRLNLVQGDHGWYMRGYAEDSGGRVEIPRCAAQ